MSLHSRRRLWAFFEALYSQELNESSPKAVTPEWIKTPLLRHQQSALAAALYIEKAKNEGIDVESIAGDTIGGRLFSSHGIIADRVGSGKSLTALALVKAPAPEATYKEFMIRGIRLGDGRDTALFRTRNQLLTAYGRSLRPVSTSLFLVPHALMAQWETYVKRDTSLSALFIKTRTEASADNLFDTIENYDVLFVSSTMWPTFKVSNPVQTTLWKRVFIDEADSISITNDTDDIHGLFYWFITASWLNLAFANGAHYNINYGYQPLPETPQPVIRHVSKLQGSNAYLSISGCRHNNIVRRMCNMAGTHLSIDSVSSQSARLIVHSSEEYIQTSFSVPTITHRDILCATPANIHVLNSFISEDMMERLNAGDLAGALESIGMSAHSENEIAEAVTLSMTQELENARRTYEYKQSIIYSTDAIKAHALEACEQKIASIESRIQAIKDRLKAVKEQTCPICYCDVTNPAVTPCCQQLFCFGCLCESLKRVAACPLCRYRITDLKTVQVIGSSAIQGKSVEEVAPERPKNKKEAFIQFVKENPGAKILMFSGYDASFSGMDAKLKEANIKFATVNGSNARITKLLKDFNAGKYNILFLNARNMGAGLNIESASHVVLFHRMSSDLENQIIGRAMRLGRTNPLDVIHLLHENERDRTISHV
jgi:hypothetical protein